jgi:tetratricopeptide (TPR) repeat protein
MKYNPLKQDYSKIVWNDNLIPLTRRRGSGEKKAFSDEENKFEKVIIKVNELIDDDPDAAVKLMEKFPASELKERKEIFIAEIHYNSDNKEFALKLLEKISKESPDCIEALLLLSVWYFELIDYDRSKKMIETIMEKYPDDPRGYLILSEIFHDIEAFEDQRKILEVYLDKYPEDPQIHGALGVAYYEKELYDEAFYHFGKATTGDPENINWRLNFCSLLMISKDEWQSCYIMLNDLANRDPDNPEVRYYLGKQCVLMEKNDEAKRELEILKNIEGEHGKYYQQFLLEFSMFGDQEAKK